jgi:hypothetical protein
MTRRRIRCRAPAVKFDLLAGSQARDRASQARGYKAEGRARHPKKSRGLLREVRDGAACKMRARPREARTARQQPKVIRRTPIRAAELFVLQSYSCCRDNRASVRISVINAQTATMLENGPWLWCDRNGWPARRNVGAPAYVQHCAWRPFTPRGPHPVLR